MRGIGKYGKYSAKNGIVYMGGGRFFESPGNALACGMQQSDVATVAAAVEQGVDLNMRFGDLEYAIIYAAKMRSTVILQLLLENGANPNVFHSSGMTPLAFASAFAGIESIKMLLESGADPNILHEERAMPVLVAAAIRGNIATAYFWEYGDEGAGNAEYKSKGIRKMNPDLCVYQDALQLLLSGFLKPTAGRTKQKIRMVKPKHRPSVNEEPTSATKNAKQGPREEDDDDEFERILHRWMLGLISCLDEMDLEDATFAVARMLRTFNKKAHTQSGTVVEGDFQVVNPDVSLPT